MVSAGLHHTDNSKSYAQGKWVTMLARPPWDGDCFRHVRVTKYPQHYSRLIGTGLANEE
jgi:hypothetical protein